MAVTSALLDVVPREPFGSWTSARYDFQRHVSILMLLELQTSESDYRVAFDHYDDIVVLNHSKFPTKIKLFQVKSKEDGPWNIGKLIEAQSSRIPKSIISKMFDHFFRLGNLVESINFLTNAMFQIPLAIGGTTGATHLKICADELDENSIKKINAAIDTEFPKRAYICDSLIFFQRVGLTVLDQDSAVRGKIQEFFERQEGADHVPTSALYKTLFESVSRSSRVGNTYGTVKQFYETKTIDRSTISLLFSKATTGRSIEKYWTSIASELSQNNVLFFDQRKINTFSHLYVADRASGNRSANLFSEIASEIINMHKENLLEHGGLIARLNVLESLCIIFPNLPYTGLKRRAALIVHLLESDFDKDEDNGAEEAPKQLEGTKQQ